MIHSAEAKASAVQEASKIISESLADSITICDMCIDNKGNIQCKDNRGNWTTVILSPTISNIETRMSDEEYQNYAIKDTILYYLDLNELNFSIKISIYLLSVLPKPPSPRCVSFNSSTSSKSTE